jgi:hypothetical protein
MYAVDMIAVSLAPVEFGPTLAGATPGRNRTTFVHISGKSLNMLQELGR